jgi:glycosyltransferase involved in cell wall biosynthesis
MARIVLAGREVWPFVEGGGLGRYVWTAARTLADHHDVTVVTTARHASMRDDPRLPAGVHFEFVDEPQGDPAPCITTGHAWSVALLDAVRGLQPDVVEFADYLGEGFATVHARRAGDPALRDTSVVVRAHTSAEMATALNETPAQEHNALIWAMERFAIRHADAFLWPGGDVLDRYRAFYGDVASPVQLSLPLWLGDLESPGMSEPPPDGPLRLLFLNRLERRKGILEFVAALLESDADVRLTVVGGDTPTGPGGESMREHLEGLIAGDERVVPQSSVDHDKVAGLIAAHHVVALPVRWETFSYVAREALAAGRPVLATPSGAIPEVVKPGVSGWLSRDLREALESLSIDAAVELSATTRTALQESLVDPAEYAAAYDALRSRFQPARSDGPVEAVEAVVAMCAGDTDVDRTLQSLAAQLGGAPRVTLVADPLALPTSAAVFRADEVVIAEGGRAGLWRAGVERTSAPFVLLVPAGAELDPGFTVRALEAFSDEFDYVTAFAAGGRTFRHAPLGGDVVAATGIDAGASVALARRQVLPAQAANERELWSGLSGVVLHEPLVSRLPQRKVDDGDPADGGAPAPAAVEAAFGDLLRTRAAA